MRTRLLFLACLIATPALSAPARVNGASSIVTTGATTATLAYGTPIIVGDAIAGCVAFVSSGGQTINTISDGTNSYTIVVTGTASAAVSMATFFGKNLAAVSSPTLTFTFSAATSTAILMADQFSGVSTSAAADAHAEGQPVSASGTNSFTSGSLTTTHNGDLIYGCAGVSSSATLTAGTGFTLGQNDSASHAWTEWQVQSTAGATAGTFTPSASDNGWVNALALQAAATAGAAHLRLQKDVGQ